jgi:hypothetical protein
VSYFKIAIVVAGLICGTLVDLGNQRRTEAKTAVISRRGNVTHVTYMYSNYSLRRVPDYPSLQYNYLDIRETGDFRYFWSEPSRINW